MKRSKDYEQCRFDTTTIRKVLERHVELQCEPEHKFNLLQTKTKGETWSHDSIDEFLIDYVKCERANIYSIGRGDRDLQITLGKGIFPGTIETSVGVSDPDRATIATIFSMFDDAESEATVPLPPLPPKETVIPRVFIGHGHSGLWRDLKDHLHEKHGVIVQAYETAARAGHTIRDILSDLADASDFALLVLTAEDESADGSIRARQNVIHETGLFQGRLGFNKAIVLMEEGVDEFSNLAGIQQIRFAKGNIKETYGEVIATLRREFGSP